MLSFVRPCTCEARFLNYMDMKQANMKHKAISMLMHGGVIMSIIFGMAACNGTDSSDKKSNDSSMDTSKTAVTDSASRDSAAMVKAKKKKKGQLSIAMPMHDSAKMVKDMH